MALTKQNMPITFSKGIDTDTDPKMVIPGTLLVLENGRFENKDTIKKRFGLTSYSRNIFSSTSTISAGNKLALFNDDLLLLNSSALYSYASSADQWISKGNFTSLTASKYSVIRNSNSQTMPDYAYCNGIGCNIWLDPTDSISTRYSLFNDQSQSLIKSDQEFKQGAGTNYPKVVATSQYLFLFSIKGTSLFVRRIDPVTLTEVNVTAVSAGLAAAGLYDVQVYGNLVVFAYNSSAGNIRIGCIVPDYVGSPVVGNGSNGGFAITAFGTEAADTCIALTVDNSTVSPVFYVSYWNTSAGKVRVFGVGASSLSGYAKVDVETIANVANITGAIDSSRNLQVYYEVRDTSTPSKTLIKKAAVKWVGTPAITVTTATAVFKRSVGLASKAFKDSSSNIFVGTVFESTLQTTYFLLGSDGTVRAKSLQGVGGGLTRNTTTFDTHLPQVVTDSGNKYVLPVREKIRLDGASGTVLSTTTGIFNIQYDFAAPIFQSSQLGGNLVVSGGYITSYDGAGLNEHGFHIFPEGVGTPTAITSGGSMADGTYQFAVTYEWIDSQGQVHRSAPSVASAAVVLSGSSGAGSYTVVAPTLRLTAKTAVKIVLYSTLTGPGTIYYRVTDIDNSTTTDTVTLTRTAADTTIAANEILYTTGGIVENIAPPSATVIHKHNNRLWIAGLDDGNTLWYTKEYFTGEAPSFSDVFTKTVTPEGGPVTALGTLDDKLIIFKEDSIYVLAGDGPTAAGVNSSFSTITRIASDLGCLVPDSIVLTQDGLLFKSKKGIRVLNRYLQLVDIGTPTTAYNSLDTNTAIMMPTLNEVRICSADGPTLVYNYQYKEWSTFTNYEAVSAILWNGLYLHLKSNGTVNYENEGSYLDNGSAYKMAIETSWLAFAGMQGFQRVYWLTLLGKSIQDHVLHISVAYDYEDVWREHVYFNTTTSTDQSYVGDGGFIGRLEPYGSGFSTYQMRFKPRIQKCESMKLRIEDLQLAGKTGPAYSISALTAVIGGKKGTDRLGDERTTGGR